MMHSGTLTSELADNRGAVGGKSHARVSSSASITSAANEPVLDFDLGPLRWVRQELDDALKRGLASLAAFCKSEKDAAALQEARRHVHQVAGAIRMLGLDAMAEFTDEIERNIVHIEGLAGPELEAAGAVVELSCRKLSIFLREIAGGAPLAPLKLYPEYSALHRSRGTNGCSPSDLFFPDLRTRAPKVGLSQAIPEEKLHAHIAKKRRLYQSGLLSWLRGDEAGAAAMRDAVADIESATAKDSLRSFWWTVRALFEAMIERGLENGPDLKQLTGRIDLQIRRVAEGSSEAAERLRREVLYYVAISAPVGPTVRAVQRAFRLSTLVPPADAINADVVSIDPLLQEARDRLVHIKETWLNFASGRTDSLPKLKQALILVQARATDIGQPGLVKLMSALVERLDCMPAGAIPDPLAMEFTTALLLAEDALQNLASLSSQFPQQVQAVLERLDAAAAGRPVTGDTTMVGELGKRARDRLLLAQVGHEIQANLHRMEEVLDTFFRDGAKRSELASLAKDLTQIHGALRILGLDAADRLLGLCAERIQACADPEMSVADAELELLAESLCGLGFYVEEVAQQRPTSERVLAPLLARWLGESHKPSAEEKESVVAAIVALRAELPRLFEAFDHDENNANARSELMGVLVRLRDDAELIGDEDLAMQADAAIVELELGNEGLAALIGALAPPAAATTISHITPESGDLRVSSEKVEVELESTTYLQDNAHSQIALAPVSESLSAPKAPASEAPRANAGERDVARDMHQRVTLVHSASIETLAHSASIETLAAVHDEIDDELLARFLVDAEVLYPAAAEKLLAWRSAARDEAAADQLSRTLHEIKGGARMAGAMRLGQLMQLMESRVLASKHKATTELFEALDADLKLVAHILAKLRAGESNVAPSSVGLKPSAEPEPRTAEPASAAPQASVAPHTTFTATDDKMRVLKANLLELSNGMARLRSEVREIEIHTDVQIRARITELNDRLGDGGSSALDGFRHIRALTQSLVDTLNGLAVVQQSLLRAADDADAGPRAQPRAVNAN